MLRLLSKFEVGPIRGLAAFCCRLLVHTAVTHTEPSATGHPTSSPAALAGRPAPSRTAHPSQKSVQAPTTGPAAPNPLKQTALLLGQIQGTSHATAPAFFELCVNQSKHLVSLGEIQLRDAFGNAVVGNDIELFGKSVTCRAAFYRTDFRHLGRLSLSTGLYETCPSLRLPFVFITTSYSLPSASHTSSSSTTPSVQLRGFCLLLTRQDPPTIRRAPPQRLVQLALPPSGHSFCPIRCSQRWTADRYLRGSTCDPPEIGSHGTALSLLRMSARPFAADRSSHFLPLLLGSRFTSTDDQ